MWGSLLPMNVTQSTVKHPEMTLCTFAGCRALVPKDWRHCVGYGYYQCKHHGEEIMSKRTKATKAEQVIMTGILTEEDIFRAMMRKHGAKGGSRNTPAQQAVRMKAINEVNRRKKERAKAKRERN